MFSRILLSLAGLLAAAHGLHHFHDHDLFNEIAVSNLEDPTAMTWSVQISSTTDGDVTKQIITKRVGDDIHSVTRSRKSGTDWSYGDTTEKLTNEVASPKVPSSKPQATSRSKAKVCDTKQSTVASHSGFSAGQSVGVMEYTSHPELPGRWRFTGRHLPARIASIQADGRFNLVHPDGRAIKPAFDSGIRHWHLKALDEEQKKPVPPRGSCGTIDSRTLMKIAQKKQLESAKRNCPDSCKCHEVAASGSQGSRKLNADGYCEEHCSRTFVSSPGATPLRFCGTGKEFTKGASVDCRQCATVRTAAAAINAANEEEAAAEKTAAEIKAKQQEQQRMLRERTMRIESEAKAAADAKAAAEATVAAEEAKAAAALKMQREAVTKAETAQRAAEKAAERLETQKRALKALMAA